LQFFPLKHHMQHLKWESSWNTSKQHPYQVLNPLSPFSKHHKLQPMRLHAKETKPRPPTIPTLCKPSINTYPTSETNHSASKHLAITQTSLLLLLLLQIFVFLNKLGFWVKV
jgi:hypothetical protein